MPKFEDWPFRASPQTPESSVTAIVTLDTSRSPQYLRFVKRPKMKAVKKSCFHLTSLTVSISV